MRIGVTTHNYPPHVGGLEIIVQELVKGFASHHEVIVVTTEWAGSKGVSIDGNVTVHRLPAWHGLERRGVPYATPLGPGVGSAFRALRTCDVIHAHGCLYATTALAALAAGARRPLYITEHVGLVPYSSRVVSTMQRAAWRLIGAPVGRRARRIVTYNGRVQHALSELFGNSAVVFVSNGVDLEKFRPLTAAERERVRDELGLSRSGVFGLFVGRATEKKNLDAVLDFKSPEYDLLVCGSDRKLPEHIRNLGLVPHHRMPEIFSASDFMVHAGVGEGFPVAVQESMACGVPVVLLWDRGYTPAVNREAVLAVDTVAELAGATQRIAADRPFRERLGAAAREFAAAHWRWDLAVEHYVTLFESDVIRGGVDGPN
jgi:glycosyltransferase involved in cell wall biosynthesis